MKLEQLSLTLLSFLPVVGCATSAAPNADEAAASSDVTSSDAYRGAHTVYTLSNVATGNAVLAFHRRADGNLEAATTTSTGGLGSDDALGSQGALAFAFDGHVLLAVNPGSNDVSSFLVDGTHLYLLSRVSSGGARPISVTAHDGLVYVLNGGSSTSVSGLYLDWFGRLHSLSNSTTAVGAGPAQISFSPNGRSLVVTEKATNKIDTFSWATTAGSATTWRWTRRARPRSDSHSRRAGSSSCRRPPVARRAQGRCRPTSSSATAIATLT